MRWIFVIALLVLTFMAIIYAPHYSWTECRQSGHSGFYCFFAKAHYP